MNEIAKQIGAIVQSSDPVCLLTLVALAAFAVIGLALLVVRDAIKKGGR